MATCKHSHIEPDAELHEDLHYEEWHCEDCGTLIYGPCHHRSMCRPDFCGLSWPLDEPPVEPWHPLPHDHAGWPGAGMTGPRF